ncbi:tol-pal system protein YbgF [Desulfovibrio sp. OttesenSCG-928-I05]|nr:tol-pal system protein YbgF [Desulfovibrio sp. OttesenSCG-928-I05]
MATGNEPYTGIPAYPVNSLEKNGRITYKNIFISHQVVCVVFFVTCHLPRGVFMPAMPVRLLMLGLLAFLSGCAMAGPTDERLWALESEMELLRTQDTRLAIVEDRLYGLSRELDGMRDAMLASGVVTFPAPLKNPAAAARPGGPAGPVPSSDAPARNAPSHPAPVSPSQGGAEGAQASPRPETPETIAQPGQPSQTPQPQPDQASTAPVPVAPPASSSAAVATPPVAPVQSAQPAQSAQSAASGEQGRYKKALSTLEAGRAQEALGLFNEFLRAYPDSKLTPNALYWRGECSYSMGRYDDAVISFKDVVARYPKDPKAAAAMLKAGYAYERLGDMDNARLYLDVLVQDYPSSDPARLARARLATL